MTDELPFIDERYRVEGILGEGGFGVVLRGFDTHLQRPVAIKLLRDLGGPRAHARAAQRFEREVSIVARLTSASIVRLLSSGRTRSNEPYAVFELVDGEELTAHLARHGTLQAGPVRQILGQLAEALHEAHSNGLLHRDIKPANIIVFEHDGDPWRVKLIDFGIARSNDDAHPRLTATGELLGTPRYMSPEQLLGEPLTPASDVYCLGLVAFEMLVGSEALSGIELHEQFERLRTGHAIAMPAEAPADLVRLVTRMCERDPSKRIQQMSNVLAALRPRQVPIRRTPASVAAAPELPVHPALLVALGVSLVVAATVAWVLATRQNDVEPSQRPTASWSSPTPPEPRSRAAAVRGYPDQRATMTANAEPDVAKSVATDGCNVPLDRVSGFVVDVEVRGQVRPTRVFTPFSYDPSKRYPVWITFHGREYDANYHLNRTGLSNLAQAGEFIAIGLDSEQQWWAAPASPWNDVRDGAAFASAAVRTMQQFLCLDTKRVFVSGEDAGADMARALACEMPLSGLFVASSGELRDEPSCEPIVPTPVIWIQGAEDPYVPRAGGRGCRGDVYESLALRDERWKRRGGCDGPAQRLNTVPPNVCTTWSCVAAPFASCELPGGHFFEKVPGWARVDSAACDAAAIPIKAGSIAWGFLRENGRTLEAPFGGH